MTSVMRENIRLVGVSPRSTPSNEPERQALRSLILASLEQQGYSVDGARPTPPDLTRKADLRALQAPSVLHRLQRAEGRLRRHEDRLIRHIASGTDVSPTDIR